MYCDYAQQENSSLERLASASIIIIIFGGVNGAALNQNSREHGLFYGLTQASDEQVGLDRLELHAWHTSRKWWQYPA